MAESCHSPHAEGQYNSSVLGCPMCGGPARHVYVGKAAFEWQADTTQLQQAREALERLVAAMDDVQQFAFSKEDQAVEFAEAEQEVRDFLKGDYPNRDKPNRDKDSAKGESADG